ncbi:golgin subfamily A member 6-like protein 2 [Phoenix dactylifera]|uniref:Golgin subfamily A member 6-like protein 2 n=1 Tax=Phoenix dactylifera TaxID=42345 RepID=A0A8B9AU61_PHODC|nr:golgin subfamily A member 6-like protein 2 [Phoenix dactylifera]
MKATTKKEEVSARLLEFLESPHVTRHVVLAENRGRKQKSIKESSQKAHGETLSNIENKKQKRSPSEEVKNFHPNKGSSKEPMRKGSKAKLKEKAVSVKKNSVKITKITSKKSAAVNNRDSGQSSTFNPQMKGKKDGQNDEKKATVVKKTVGKKAAKSASNVSTKGKGKVKVGRKPPPEPTEEEMRAVVMDFADEFEFQKISAGDIFRQLEAYFKMDLSHRWEEVRRIIDDVFTDDEEDNQDNDADASRGDDAERSGEDAGEEEVAEGSGEDAGEEEDVEGSGEDAGEEEDAEGSGEDAGEEEDAEGSGEDAGEEEEDAERSGKDAGGAEEDAEGSGEDAGGAEEDAEGSGEDAGGEEDAAEGSDEDAGE